MRQLLMLGFYCEVYRREPLCRVYINNVLVDEFNISHTPRIDAWKADMILDPAIWFYDRFIHESSPSFYKFIEFNDFDCDYLDIRVEIQNNDNNYANGFMTQHTRVMLSQCYLANIKLWGKFDQIKNRWKFCQRNWHGNGRSIAKYYSGLRNHIFNNLAYHTEMHFPDIVQQLQSKEKIKLNFSNYQDLPRQWQNWPNKHWVGSSGYFHLTLTKKLGFWRHSTDRRRGWWKLSHLNINFLTNLYNKYKQYEDQRSINT